VSVVCCQLEVSATRWSLVQRSPPACGASLCVIKKRREWGGQDPLGGAIAPRERERENKREHWKKMNDRGKTEVIREIPQGVSSPLCVSNLQ